MIVLKFLVFMWLTMVAVWAARQLFAGAKQTALFCLLGHWLFCAMPLALDVLWGVPTYTVGRNLERSANDPATDLIYLVYAATIPVILYLFASRSLFAGPAGGLDLRHAEIAPDAPRGSNLLLYFFLCLPILIAAGAPRPDLYLIYGFHARTDLELTPEIMNYNALVQLSSILAIIAAVILVRKNASTIRSLIYTLPWSAAALYLAGKRFILVFYLALLTKSLWDKGELKGARMPIYFGLVTMVMVGFSILYQTNVRGFELAGRESSKVYENVRIDYGRDHTIKLAIFSELRQEPILTHRGQSLVFYASMYVPRSWWAMKPQPYATYLTCYALGIKPKVIYWGLTTSIFDEAVANFSWAGLLIGPALLGLLCRITDRNTNSVLRILGMLTCLLLMAVQVAAIMPLFLLWLFGSFWDQHRAFFSLRPRLRRPESAE